MSFCSLFVLLQMSIELTDIDPDKGTDSQQIPFAPFLAAHE